MVVVVVGMHVFFRLNCIDRPLTFLDLLFFWYKIYYYGLYAGMLQFSSFYGEDKSGNRDKME